MTEKVVELRERVRQLVYLAISENGDSWINVSDKYASQICQLFEEANCMKPPLFRRGDFTLHSGGRSNFRIDCDALTDNDWETLAVLIASKVTFGVVIGVPTGGFMLAQKLAPYITKGGGTLIVDDVLTTGISMEEMRKNYPGAIGIVVFARGKCPDWITPLFQMRTDVGKPADI